MDTKTTYHAVLSHFDGSPTKLAAALDIDSTPRVCNWRDRGIPADVARKIESLTGISVKVLRPNDWHMYWPERATSRDIARAA